MTGSSGRASRMARVRAHLAAPFVRNAYSLVGSALATSGLGLVFWILTARLYPIADVGRASTLIATMLFLSSLSQLNLTNGFNRFVPVAGHRTRRLVVAGYAAAVGTACVAASVFVLGVDLWAPELGFVHSNWEYGIWFVIGTAVYTLFALQDAVLTGLGEALTVLVENVVYGVVKIGLLVVAVVVFPDLGAFAAWTLPLIPVVIVINALIFGRMIPARDHAPLEAVDARSVRRFVGFDMVAAWMLTATIGLLPLITLSILGPDASAYLYQSWTIAYTLYLISIMVGMSLVTEASRAPEQIVELARKMIVHSLRIVTPLALIVALAAPLALRLWGEEYADNATTLLQLLALSAIPNAVTATYLSIARTQRRLQAVVLSTAALAGLVLALAVVFANAIGVTGIGVAWLIGQTVVASVLLLGELRTVWLPIVAVGRLRGRAGRREPRSRSARAVAAEGRALLAMTTLTTAEWAVERVARAPDEVRVADVRSIASGSAAVLSVGSTARAADAVRRDVEGLRRARNLAPEGLREVLSRPLAEGSGRAAWSLLEARPGVDARSLLDRRGGDAVSADLTRRIVELHRVTVVSRRLGDDLPELLDLPLAATGSLPKLRLRVRADETSLARLQAELRAELTGLTVTTAFVHGNLWLGNVLANPDGRVTGLLRWERSRIDLPVIDLLHLVCTTRAEIEHTELGRVVRDVISGGGLHDAERELVAAAPGARELSTRTAVLLMWLRHVQGYTRHFEGSRPSHVWLSHNVHQVLESV